MRTIFIIFIFFLSLNNSVAKSYNIGDKVTNILDINSDFKINLSDGDWEVVRKEFDSVYTIRQFILGIGKIVGLPSVFPSILVNNVLVTGSGATALSAPLAASSSNTKVYAFTKSLRLIQLISCWP